MDDYLLWQLQQLAARKASLERKVWWLKVRTVLYWMLTLWCTGIFFNTANDTKGAGPYLIALLPVVMTAVMFQNGLNKLLRYKDMVTAIALDVQYCLLVLQDGEVRGPADQPTSEASRMTIQSTIIE